MIRLKEILKEITISDPPGTLKVGRLYKVGYNLKPLEYRGRIGDDTHMFITHDNKPEFRTNSQIELGVQNGVIRLLKPGERLDEISIGYGYDELMKSFPGHARLENPIDGEHYQWYLKAVEFVRSTDNIHQAAEVVKFFQNNFLGMDYDDTDTDEEIVKWWLSDEEQDWIRDEITPPSDEYSPTNIKPGRHHSRGINEIIVKNDNRVHSINDLKVGTKYDLMTYYSEPHWFKNYSYDGIDWGGEYGFIDHNIFDGGRAGYVHCDKRELQSMIDNNEIVISDNQ